MPFTTNGQPKQVDCIRVDGSSDVGPSHEEVQYWWTERHFQRVATLLHGAVVVATSIGWSYKMAASPKPMPMLSYHQRWLDHALILILGLWIERE